METKLLIPNAIVFLYDLTAPSIQIPEYKEDTIVSYNKSCISIGTQSDVDGEVTLKLSEKINIADKDHCEKIFNGEVDTSGKKLAISTSEVEGVLEISVKTSKTPITIWVDDTKFPSLVLIEVE